MPYDEFAVEPAYMERVAPGCHMQLPIMSAIGRGPMGPQGPRGEAGLDSRKDFDTVANMVSDGSLEPGDICCTLGFHAVEDGGAAWYKITDDATPNGMDVIALDNGNYALLKITTPYVTPEMFGAYGDGVHDDASAINYCVYNYKNVISKNVYKCSNPIVIDKTVKIKGYKSTFNFVNSSGFIIGENNNVENVVIEGLTIIGDSSANTVGIDLHRMKWRSVIKDCYIKLFETGIKTNIFDGCIGLKIDNVYCGECTNCIDDTEAGLQAALFIGGRYEQNTNGLLLASPNLLFNGCIIEGNDNFDVKLVNDSSVNACSAHFNNCYFENGNVSPFVLGTNGFYGSCFIENSVCLSKNNLPFLVINGDAISAKSEKSIIINNCNGFLSKTVGCISAPNVGTDTKIIFNSPCKTNAFTWNINSNAKFSYQDDTMLSVYRVNAQRLVGLGAELAAIEYVRTKKVNVALPDNSGTFTISMCIDNPWDNNSGAGAAPGALCFSKNNKKLYLRTTYASDSSAWNEINITAVQ